MAKDLRCFVNRHAISARRTGPAERAIRWARKNKALTAMACLTLLIGVAAAIFGYINSREKQQLADKKKELTGENRRLQREQALEKALEKAMSGKFKEAKKLGASAIGFGADKNSSPMIDALEQIFVGNAADAVKTLEEVVAENREKSRKSSQNKPRAKTAENTAFTAGQPIHPSQRQPGDHADFFPGDLAVAAHPAVVADFLKSLRQDVLSEARHEVVAFDGAGLDRFRSGRLILVRDRGGIDVADAVPCPSCGQTAWKQIEWTPCPSLPKRLRLPIPFWDIS